MHGILRQRGYRTTRISRKASACGAAVPGEVSPIMIQISDRAFLCLHIEAVWEISIPPLDGATVELPAGNPLPPWLVYRASLADGQVTIWRPGVSLEEQTDLLARAGKAGLDYDPALGMRREVVLRLSWTTANPSPSACRRRSRTIRK